MRAHLRVVLALTTLATLAFAGTAQAKKSTDRRYVAKPGEQAMIRVAVLPFSAAGPGMDASPTVTTQLVNYLLATGKVSVVEPGLVKEAYTKVRLMRGDEDLTVPIVQQLAENLKVDVLIVGRIDEWELLSAGSESFPSVGLHARMIDVRDARILWADTVARTGKGGFLGSGSVNSLNILSRMATRQLAKSAERALPQIAEVLASEPVAPVTVAARAASSAAETVASAAAPPAPPQPPPAPEVLATATPNNGTNPESPPAPNGNGAAHQDPTKRFTNGELAALLVEVEGFERGEPTFGRHQYEYVVTKYRQNGVAMEVQLVDYWQADTAERFLRQRNRTTEISEFQGCPSLSWVSDFGYAHLGVAAGRFGVFLRGPAADKALAEEIAMAVVKRLVG